MEEVAFKGAYGSWSDLVDLVFLVHFVKIYCYFNMLCSNPHFMDFYGVMQGFFIPIIFNLLMFI